MGLCLKNLSESSGGQLRTLHGPWHSMYVFVGDRVRFHLVSQLQGEGFQCLSGNRLMGSIYIYTCICIYMYLGLFKLQ